MQEEKELALDDPDNPQRVLAKLRDNPQNFVGKTIYIPWERTKFVCPNHKIIMTINMSDNNIRYKQNKMESHVCDCGITYVRTKNQNLHNYKGILK